VPLQHSIWFRHKVHLTTNTKNSIIAIRDPVALCRNRKVVDETMLSKAIYECINFNTRFGYLLGSFPFQWDSKRKKLKITNSKFKLFQWYFIILYFISNSIFMTIRAFQAMCCMNVTYVLIFMNLFNVCSWITVCAVQLNSMLYKGEIVNFLNQLMWTEELFDSKFIFKTHAKFIRLFFKYVDY